MFAEIVKAIVESATEKPRAQPTEIDISTAIILFPGRLVTYQAFKVLSPRSLRSVQKPEYHHCTQTIKWYGRVKNSASLEALRRCAFLLRKQPMKLPIGRQMLNAREKNMQNEFPSQSTGLLLRILELHLSMLDISHARTLHKFELNIHLLFAQVFHSRENINELSILIKEQCLFLSLMTIY